jgi:N-acetylneuraminic acid mutarotase
VLVFGGISLTGTDDGVRMVSGNVVLSSAELYDPRTDSWATTGSMAEGRSGATAILLPDGRVLAAGGWGATELFGPKLATAELYDPGTGTWTATGAMASARDGHAAVLLPTGKVLVAGGYDRDRLASAELYDPISGLWVPTGRLPERFITRIVLLLKDGRVLLAGGDVPSGPGAKGSAHAALYDVDAGTWTAAQPMLEGRLAASFALLPDGRVLVVGGRMYGAPDAVSFRTAEVYDPATGTWIATADLPGPRSGGSAVLLPDGRVLVVGGVGDGLEVLASAEIFALDGRS